MCDYQTTVIPSVSVEEPLEDTSIYLEVMKPREMTAIMLKVFADDVKYRICQEC